MSTKLIITFATRYNGISLNFVDDDIKPTYEQFSAFDKVADTLPTFTYKWAKDNWDHMLSDKHIKKLCDKAAKIVHPVLPDVDISFEYDTTSS